jgi:hypothetical protein|tara:strand:+ start:388 stop:501 length:114 start_codon:yes stop_codon:yes gene_type:complete
MFVAKLVCRSGGHAGYWVNRVRLNVGQRGVALRKNAS